MEAKLVYKKRLGNLFLGIFFIKYFKINKNSMKTYLITYQLNKEWQNYYDLYSAIKNYKYIVHSMQSIWFIKTNLSAVDIIDG